MHKGSAEHLENADTASQLQPNADILVKLKEQTEEQVYMVWVGP